MKFPQHIGPVHFIGIGGIGMSGIAEVLVSLGYEVQGSDVAENSNVQRLKKLGIKIRIGHDAGNVGNAEIVVVSSAIRRDNPELIFSIEKKLPVVRRAEMLAELMRFKQAIAVGGTHGKTTTTSMVATLLDAGGFEPTVINGGIINAYGSNARIRESDWMVVEADESDGTFVHLPADIAVVTNIDPEHLDYYGDFEGVRKAYTQFVENVPFYGIAVMCIDHPEVQTLIGQIEDRRIVSYGENPQSDFRIYDIKTIGRHTQFSISARDRRRESEFEIKDLIVPMPGMHNVANATAAVAVAHHLGMSPEVIREGLNDFGGVKRRFTYTGQWNGVEIFDDYGHHPVEVKAVLKAARDSCDGNVIAVMQPHRYSRLSGLFDEFCSCFNDADSVFISPVYSAGEQPLNGFDRDKLVTGVKARGHRSVQSFDSPDELVPKIAKIAKPGDMILFLGAGNITQWANDLPNQLSTLDIKGSK